MFCREPDSAIGMSRAVSANRAHNGRMEQAQGILEGLDERQRTAATTLQGPVRIIAGAGAGKTRTVTRRIAYACATGAWKPERVLAVTFSVKAAAEMRARLGQLGVGGGTGRSGSGAGTAGVTAATFHSAALHQLNSVWADICEAPFPHVIEDQRDVVSRAIIRATARTDADPLTVRDVLAEINWAKISLDGGGRLCPGHVPSPIGSRRRTRHRSVRRRLQRLRAGKDLAWRNRF